jgi:hypothetical protein
MRIDFGYLRRDKGRAGEGREGEKRRRTPERRENPGSPKKKQKSVPPAAEVPPRPHASVILESIKDGKVCI